MSNKFYYTIITRSCTGKEALAVQVDEGVDLMYAFAEHININDDIEKVYAMRTLEQAQETARLFNKSQEKSTKDMEEIIMKEIKKDNRLTFNGKEVTVPSQHIEFAENLMEQEMFDKNDMLVVLPAKKYNTESEKRVDEMEDIEKGMIRSEVVNFENNLTRFRKVVARVFGKDSDESYNFRIASQYLRHTMRILSDVAFEVDSESDLFDLMENDD